MNVLIVDTSIWISYFKGTANEELDLGLSEGRIYLPPLVAAELLSGKMKSTQQEQLEDFLRELPVCQTDLDHWLRVGRLRRELLALGYFISTPDAHIAQCALDLKGYLMSGDSIFHKVSGHIGLRLV